jgi:hypothetical protein
LFSMSSREAYLRVCHFAAGAPLGKSNRPEMANFAGEIPTAVAWLGPRGTYALGKMSG